MGEIFRYHGVYSSAKLRRDVPEYNPTTTYEDGIRQTVAWLDQHKKIEPAASDPFDDRLVGRWETFTRDTVKTLAPQG